MSVQLLKDWTYKLVKAGTPVTQPTITKATYTVTEPHFGNTIPIVQDYPTNPATITSPGIRLASASEVSALKAFLYGGVAEPMQTTLFNQLHYSGEYGKPLQVYSQTSYISVWYGQQGLGFYVFVGYNQDSYPTQEIEISSIQRV